MNMLITCSTQPDRCESFAFAHRRSPVLVVGDHADDNQLMEIAVRLARTNAGSVAGTTSADLSEEGWQTGFGEIEDAWRRLEEEFHSACVGVVATSPRAVASVSRMLAKGWADERIPGAIVLLGYSRSFGAACLHVANQLATQIPAPDGRSHGDLPAAAEWPAMLLLLPRDEPTVVECLDACGKLRSVGISVEFEFVDGTRQDTGETTDKAVQMIHGFFSKHLVPYFPKRI